MSSELLSIEEAAEHMGGIGRTTLFVLIREGEIGVVKIGRRTMIPVAEIKEFIERNMTQARRVRSPRRVTCKRCGHEHLCMDTEPPG